MLTGFQRGLFFQKFYDLENSVVKLIKTAWICGFRTLYRQGVLICNDHFLVLFLPVCPAEFNVSYRAHYVDHLAADGACLLGGQVAVVALLEVHAYLP